ECASATLNTIPRAVSCSYRCSSIRAPAVSTYGDVERSQTTMVAWGVLSMRHPLADGFDVEIEKRRLHAERNEPRKALVIRMPLEIGEAVRPRNPAQKCHM